VIIANLLKEDVHEFRVSSSHSFSESLVQLRRDMLSDINTDFVHQSHGTNWETKVFQRLFEIVNRDSHLESSD